MSVSAKLQARQGSSSSGTQASQPSADNPPSSISPNSNASADSTTDSPSANPPSEPNPAPSSGAPPPTTPPVNSPPPTTTPEPTTPPATTPPPPTTNPPPPPTTTEPPHTTPVQTTPNPPPTTPIQTNPTQSSPTPLQPSTVYSSTLYVSTTSPPYSIESTATSVNATLMLGSNECASDPQAQSDGSCPSSMYCNAASKVCIAKALDGTVCAADFQCNSGYCVGTCQGRPSGASQHALSGGAIAGIVVGALAALGLLAAVFWYCQRRHRKQRNLKLYAQDFNDSFTEMQGKRASKYNFLAQMLSKDQLALQSDEQLMISGHSHTISHDLASSAASPYLGHDRRPISNSSSDYAMDFSDYADPPSMAQATTSFTRQARGASITALQPRPLSPRAVNDSPPPPMVMMDHGFGTLTPSGSVASPNLAQAQPRYASPRHASPRPRPDSEALPAIDTSSFMNNDLMWDDSLEKPAAYDAWTNEDQATMSPVDSHAASFSPHPSTLGPSSTLRTTSTHNTSHQQHSPFF
ncbi:hypothetical protein DM01DRAFT_1336910 [Hesseltinella vesiculosa]|uniref:Uncharacterized protein n=1 Tax=Hesseltinella vesiculosa TaxID=101127 RepID=A0A1X2GEF9_9FUNG|nr:hypothetical protein DM01DRAFT_1336910 [Hesseltinella vesiculosa]